MSSKTLNIKEIIAHIRNELNSLWEEDYSSDYDWEEWIVDQYNSLEDLNVGCEEDLLINHCGGIIQVISSKYDITLDQSKNFIRNALKIEGTIIGIDNLFG